jgi:hypothetical protein
MNLSIEKDIDDILNPENDWNQYDSALYGLDHREKQSTKVTNQQELEEEKEEEIEEEREKASLSIWIMSRKLNLESPALCGSSMFGNCLPAVEACCAETNSSSSLKSITVPESHRQGKISVHHSNKGSTGSHQRKQFTKVRHNFFVHIY